MWKAAVCQAEISPCKPGSRVCDVTSASSDRQKSASTSGSISSAISARAGESHSGPDLIRAARAELLWPVPAQCSRAEPGRPRSGPAVNSISTSSSRVSGVIATASTIFKPRIVRAFAPNQRRVTIRRAMRRLERALQVAADRSIPIPAPRNTQASAGRLASAGLYINDIRHGSSLPTGRRLERRTSDLLDAKQVRTQLPRIQLHEVPRSLAR